MPKTYPAIGPFAPGDILTAATMTSIDTNIENLRVPACVLVRRTSDLTGYAGAAITWQSEDYDTDAMGAASSNVTIGTAGLYLVHFQCYYTGAATITGAEPRISLNGNIRIRSNFPSSGSTTGYFSATGVISCAASDTISAAVGFSGGSAYVIKGSSSESSDRTWMSVTWLGQVS